jgi:hypothetical protein
MCLKEQSEPTLEKINPLNERKNNICICKKKKNQILRKLARDATKIIHRTAHCM